MKNENKVFVSVPITQEIIEKLDKEFYFCLDRNNEETLFNTNTLKEFPNRFKGCQILIEQPLPIGKTAENDSQLRKSFSEETGVDVFNSQREFDIDYIHWLEQRILDVPSSQLQPSQVGETMQYGNPMYNGKCNICKQLSCICEPPIVLPSDEDIDDLKLIRGYFGTHDKTTFEHACYNTLDKLIKRLASHKGEQTK